MNPTQKFQRGRDPVMTMPAAIERARTVLRSRLVDFILPNLIGHIARMGHIRENFPDDPLIVCLNRTPGDKLVPVIGELIDEETGGLSLTAPFNMELKRDACLAFANLVAHVFFAEGLRLSAGFVNAQGRGFVFRITGIDGEGKADVKCNQLQGRIDEAAN